MAIIILSRSDLARPAITLYMHNLTGVLEAAIRATNAQYEDPEILQRVDCRLLEVLFDNNSLTRLQLRNKTCFPCLCSLVNTEANVCENLRADQ